MTDPDPPKTSNRGRFQPGHKLATGRPKNSPNKNLREHAITGLTRGGANKAKKAGKNGSVNGLAYFFEDLAEKNSSAAAALAGKLISSEPEQKTDASGYTTPIIVNTVVSGNMFAPGKTVLLPFDECAEAWAAYHDGTDAWKSYVLTLEPILTKAAFEALSLVEAPIKPDVEEDVQRSNVTPLRLIEAPVDQERAKSEADQARESYFRSLPDRAAREAFLNTLSTAEMARLAGIEEGDYVDEG